MRVRPARQRQPEAREVGYDDHGSCVHAQGVPARVPVRGRLLPHQRAGRHQPGELTRSARRLPAGRGTAGDLRADLLRRWRCDERRYAHGAGLQRQGLHLQGRRLHVELPVGDQRHQQHQLPFDRHQDDRPEVPADRRAAGLQRGGPDRNGKLVPVGQPALAGLDRHAVGDLQHGSAGGDRADALHQRRRVQHPSRDAERPGLPGLHRRWHLAQQQPRAELPGVHAVG